MSGDYSRVRFDPKNDFAAVLMQQGRVQLDSDWNELEALLDRRWRTETVDIIGTGTVPKETPDGFRIQIASGALTVGRGRIYVDGLLAENHGKVPLEFDPVLAEQRGTLAVPYDEQPYFPNVKDVAPAPTAGGPHLVYVDVWQREVTFLENSNLVEAAVGVDTTARWQTVWQVKILPNVGSGATCGSPLVAWNSLVAPSDARLSSKAVGGVPTNNDPCLLPPSGGYRGLENRLYRVEIHDGGTTGMATFKWSRDNASVASAVTAITALDKLTVASVGRDSIMHFKSGDWIEITDDWLEFACQPGVSPQPAGVLAQIKSVDDANRTLTLMTSIPANVFGTDSQGNTDPARHTRVRRWDQSGQVRDTNGNLLVDLNAPGSKGVIPVPAAGVSIVLEDGVQITFNTPTGGKYKIGDYWNFAARTANSSVEELKESPPRGSHHHFCRLALVTFPEAPIDCRVLWPPENEENCDCTICVSADSHNEKTLTIQDAINKVAIEGTGGTVCLGPGTYELREGKPITISAIQALRIRGHGISTMITYTGSGPALLIERSQAVLVEDLTILATSLGNVQPAVAVINSQMITLQRSQIMRVGESKINTAAIGLQGNLVGITIRENYLFGPTGIGNMFVEEARPLSRLAVSSASAEPPDLAPLGTALLRIEGNAIGGGKRGISLIGTSIHAVETSIHGNLFRYCPEGGIVLLGFVPRGSALSISNNTIIAGGSAIIIGAGGSRISENIITAPEEGSTGNGILCTPGFHQDDLDSCEIFANRISGVAGSGILIEGNIKSAMIKNNVIQAVDGGGIVMGDRSRADTLIIENNQLLDITPKEADQEKAVTGVRIVNTKQLNISHNVIARVGQRAYRNRSRAGIQLIASHCALVSCNKIADIGPSDGFLNRCVAIESLGTFGHIRIDGNNICRSQHPVPDPEGKSEWIAVAIMGGEARRTSLPVRLGFGTKGRKSFVFLPNQILSRSLDSELVELNGNHSDVFGLAPAVHINVAGASILNGNQCVLRGGGQPVVEIHSGAAIATANYLRGQEKVPSMYVRVSHSGASPITATGNITSGPIEVQLGAGARVELPPPWKDLNVLA